MSKGGGGRDGEKGWSQGEGEQGRGRTRGGRRGRESGGEWRGVGIRGRE